MLAVRQLVRQQVHSVSGDKNLAQSHFYFREEKLGQKLGSLEISFKVF